MSTPEPPLTRRLVAIVLIWSIVTLAAVSLIFTHFSAIRPRPEFGSGLGPLVGGLDVFDASNYATISLHGYVTSLPGLRAFFPLLPLVIRGLTAPFSWIVRGETGFAAVATLFNMAALATGVVMIAKLVRFEFRESRPYWAVAGLLCFPGSFFLLAPYTESLFLVLMVSSFYAARTGKWWLAGVIGAFASATRLPGIILIAALAVEYAQQHDWQWRKFEANIWWLALIPVGALAYFGWLQSAGGWHTYVAAYHASWPDRHPSLNILGVIIGPFVTLARHHIPKPNDILGLVGLGLGIAFLARFRAYGLRWSYGVLVATALVLPLLSGSLESLLRYVMVLFPLYLLFQLVARKHVTAARVALGLGLILNLGLMAAFVRGVFVG